MNSISKKAKDKLRATPEGRIKANLASKLSYRKIRATPEGLKRRCIANKKYTSTPEGKAKSYANTLKWARANPAKHNAHRAKYRATKLQATPIWYDDESVLLVYKAARAKSRRTGIAYEVDHIEPLQGKHVCGLHWSGNLQILTKSANCSKGNRYAD